MRLKKLATTLLVATSAISMLSGTSPWSTAPNAKFHIFDQDSYIYNNSWGGGTNGEQGIRRKDGHADFKWNWKGSGNSVQAYPSVVRGWHWDSPRFSTHKLPISVASPPSCKLQSKLNYAFNATGSYDVAYDLWAATDRNLSWRTHPSLEVMIWGEHQDANPAGTPVSTVSIAGHDWTVWKGSGAFGGPVVSFVSDRDALRHPLDLMQFVREAAGANVDSRLRLISTEFGVEVEHGVGSATIRDWSERRSASCR